MDKQVKKEQKKKGTVREYVESFGWMLLLAIFLKVFVVASYAIPTGSMKDTLLIGDALFANQFIYGARTPSMIPLVDVKIPHIKLPALKKPNNGDIIIFKYPKDEKFNYVKRCIAVPGQTVECRQGIIYVNGKPEGNREFIKRDYDPEDGFYCNYYQITMDKGKKYVIRYFDNMDRSYESWGPLVVPDGKYFMMGDNRDNSADSRVWGYVPYDNIVGQPLMVYFSWDKTVPLYKIHQKIRWGRFAHLIK